MLKIVQIRKWEKDHVISANFSGNNCAINGESTRSFQLLTQGQVCLSALSCADLHCILSGGFPISEI